MPLKHLTIFFFTIWECSLGALLLFYWADAIRIGKAGHFVHEQKSEVIDNYRAAYVLERRVAQIIWFLALQKRHT